LAAALNAMPADPLARAYHRSLALRWLATVLALPVLVPLLLARGLDLSQVALVMATFAAVTAALEVPTGGLADAFGRVRVTVLADAGTLLAQLAFMLAPGLPGLLAAAALGGAARALGSGSLEAWYVDARRARDPAGDLQGPLARAGVVQSLVLALAMLVGGALPLLAPLLGIAEAGDVRALQLTYAAAAAVWIVSITVTSRLHEVRSASADARRATRAAARPDRVARVALTVLRSDAPLVVLVMIGATLGAVVMGMETFLPAELQARWGPEGVSVVLGTVMAVAFGATAAGQALAARQASTAWTAPLTGAVLGAVLISLGTGVVALDTTALARVAAIALAAAGSWSVYLGLGLATPSLAAAFHDRVPSAQRATMLSLRSLAAYAGGVVATLALGRLAEGAGLVPVWLVVAGLAAGVALTAARWRGTALAGAARESAAPADAP
jgi:MFS family permease